MSSIRSVYRSYERASQEAAVNAKLLLTNAETRSRCGLADPYFMETNHPMIISDSNLSPESMTSRSTLSHMLLHFTLLY